MRRSTGKIFFKKTLHKVFDRSIRNHICSFPIVLAFFYILFTIMTFTFFFSFKDVLTEVTCNTTSTIAFMRKHGIIKSEVHCPGPSINGSHSFPCGGYMVSKKTNDTKDQEIWRCRKAHTVVKGNCKYTMKDVKLTIHHESWLVDSKLPLQYIVELMYLWSQSFSVDEIMHELKLSKKTVVEWANFFREACFTTLIDGSEQIGGNGVEVEIDESKFGKCKYYRGHRVEGQWVFGGREKYNKRKVFMIPVKDRKQNTLIPLIQKWIHPGSIIHSDCWKSYNKLPKLGYTHVTVNHSKEFLNKENAACTNGIESDWCHAKVLMPRYGVHRGMHSGYLAEFMWRRKHMDEDKFIQLITDINAAFKKKYLQHSPTAS